MRSSFSRSLAEALAAAFLAGPWSARAMAARAARAVSRRPPWLARLAAQVRGAFGAPPVDRFETLVRTVCADEALQDACTRGEAPRVHRVFEVSLGMTEASQGWDVPRLDTPGDVARWLELNIGALEWLVDWRGLGRHARPAPLRHYVERWVPKRSGGARLLEAPKSRLKGAQRKILDGILARIPTHEAAHGFRLGHDVVSHAALHAGRALVLCMDLEDFFLSIDARRVFGVFREAGYPEAVARVLTGLCTVRARAEGPPLPPNPTASDVAAVRRARQRYRTRHLPQGAPTSPALANLVAYRLDVRLDAAARLLGATYTRYADDLVFSGDAAFARDAARFRTLVAAIALDCGFRVNHRKTRLMRRGSRQRVTGLVVNEQPAISRADFDALKALLHNCVRTGPSSQNREGHVDFRAHLEGVVAWVNHVQPRRGEKLRALLGRIDWER
jgi:hypothetical protein